VLATQNPIELEGTYPLPEAQLDRFLFNVVLDYLTADDELDVVNRNTTRDGRCRRSTRARRRGDPEVPVAGPAGAGPRAVNRFAVDLVRATRPDRSRRRRVVRRYIQYGASVRATQFLALAAKARALMAAATT
jgi:MoxR-like ATPase